MRDTPCIASSFRRNCNRTTRHPFVECSVLGALFDGISSKEHAMSANIYVGNLSFNTSTSQLEGLFAEYGEVTKAQVVTDRDTGQSRGFGFVEMANQEQAQKAISAIHGTEVDGRQLKVNEAKPRSR
jgi:RNA recognition motif-containing protein